MAERVTALEERAFELRRDLEAAMPAQYRDPTRRDPAGYQVAWRVATEAMEEAVGQISHLAQLLRDRAEGRRPTRAHPMPENEDAPDDVPY